MSTHPQGPTKQDLKTLGLDPDIMPRHVAMIMDGNGRWAKKRFLPRIAGHKQGAEALRRSIKACAQLGIDHLSVYVFSTENWKRPKEEVSFLMNYFSELIHQETPELCKQGVRVKVLGDLADLSDTLRKNIDYIEKETENNTTVQLNMLLNYGSRREILQACENVVALSKENPNLEVTEDLFSNQLYSKGIPDPDIMIRTGGDVRISNFLLWQLAYTECFFIETLWPDFDKETLISVIKIFQKRDRRFGGIES